MLSELRDRDKYSIISLYVESKNTKFTDTEKRLAVARGGARRVGKMTEGGQKAQTSSCKVNKS